jgi:hypothetical protein
VFGNRDRVVKVMVWVIVVAMVLTVLSTVVAVVSSS